MHAALKAPAEVCVAFSPKIGVVVVALKAATKTMSKGAQKIPRISVNPAVYKLPAHLTREIGRLIVHWAHFEFLLQSTVWILLGIDEKKGRVAVPDLRSIEERFEMIVDLVFLNNIRLNKTVLDKMKASAIAMSSKRNLLAHGVWIKDDEGWKVQQTRGKYPHNVTAHSRKRRIAPEVIRVETKGLQSVIQNIERLIQAMQQLRDSIRERMKVP